jgi:cytochrome oxidase assembly protein ShyY1
MWEKLYAIAWFALAVGAFIVTPVVLSGKRRG